LEEIMRRLIYGMGVLCIASLVQAGGAGTALAQASAPLTYPWCAHYGGRMGGAPNCGFTTREQCMATIAGMGGSCQMNPAYTPPARPQRR
jgi:hypothetical protein